MALTVTSGKTLYNKTTIGANVVSIIDVVSTVALTNEAIYFKPILFLPAVTPPQIGIDEIPTEGYVLSSYTSIAGTYDMDFLPFPNSYLWQNYQAKLTITDSLNFSIEFSFLMTADEDGAIDPLNTLNTTDRLLKNNINNPINLNNSTPSVYNEDRVLRLEVAHITDDPANYEIDTLDLDFTNTGWYCEGETSNWSITLFRNGLPVNNLSAFEDTEVKFIFATTNGGTPVNYNVGIFKVTGTNNNDIFYEDINLSYVSVNPTLTTIDPFDDSGFTSATAITPLATVFQGSFVINADYVEPGVGYQMIIVPAWTTGVPENVQASCITRRYPASQDPPATTGTVTSEVCTYDDLSSCYDTQCITGAATCQRLRICAEMDKDIYDANIFTNNTTGDYDSNIVGSPQYLLSGFLPDDLGTLTGFQDLDNLYPENNGGCIEYLKIPESWAGQTNYVIYRWHFQLSYTVTNQDGSTTPVIYDDFIYYPISITTNELDDGTNIGFTLTDQDGNPLNDVLCAGEVECINVDVTESYTTNHNLIPLVQKDGGAWEEFSPFPNDNITALTTPFIKESDAVIPDGGTGNFKIDVTKFDLNSSYCFKVVLPCTNSSAPVECPCFDMTLLQQIILISENQIRIELTYDIQNLVDPTEFISIEWYRNGSLLGIETVLTNNVFVIVPNDGQFIVSTITAIVTLQSCVYNLVGVLETAPVQDAVDTEVLSVCEDTCDYLAFVRYGVGGQITDLVADGVSIAGDPEFSFPYLRGGSPPFYPGFTSDLETWHTNNGFAFTTITLNDFGTLNVNGSTAILDTITSTDDSLGSITNNFFCTPV